jgi:DHA1 family bicyclomycin/chloramphenicol resistance-like MFS transporter
MNTGLARRKSFVLVLGSLTGMAALSIDISLPAIPAMVHALSTTLSSGQQIVGAFMAGLAVGQLPAGLFSDRFGRMPVLYFGTALFTVAAFACAMSDSIELMLIGRFLQGMGGSCGVVVSRAIVRDVASGSEAARLMSVLLMVFSATPMLAPILGAHLTEIYGWRMPFVAVVVFVALMLLGIKSSLRETHVPQRKHNIGHQLFVGARIFASHRQSVLGLLLVLMPTAAFLSLIAGSSSMAIEIYGFSPRVFGYVFAGAGFSILVSSWVNRWLLARISLMQATGVGIAIMFISSIQLLFIVWLNEASFWWLWGNVCLFFFASGFVLSNATALALDPVPEIAGVASSLMGTTQSIASAATAIMASLIYDGSVRNVVVIMSILGLATVVLFLARNLVLGGQPLYVAEERPG